MVAKPPKVYTKLQGNVDKINVRLSSQFAHEHWNFQKFMEKLRRLILSTFSCPFISITFMWFNIQICSHLPNYIWYNFLCSWEHWAKLVTSISKARKVPCSWNFIIENSRQFLFKTKDLLLQKILINRFLEHDGMRVLPSALFSSCMIGYTMMTTLFWQKFLLLQRS